jgi:hypothetical protein
VRIERRPLLTWFGVLGAPLAWTLQLWIATGLTIATCGRVRRDVPVDALAVGLTALAAVTAALAGASAFAVLRQTRDAPDAPPGGRVHFLATIGVTVSFLFGCLIVMTGLGVAFTDLCRQS